MQAPTKDGQGLPRPPKRAKRVQPPQPARFPSGSPQGPYDSGSSAAVKSAGRPTIANRSSWHAEATGDPTIVDDDDGRHQLETVRGLVERRAAAGLANDEASGRAEP